jgi:hypothetical protein
MDAPQADVTEFRATKALSAKFRLQAQKISLLNE